MKTIIERFIAKIEPTECWKWSGATIKKGYGQMKRFDKLDYAHRIAYEQFHGPIPEGMHIDHLCRNRACVNPLHLEAVTAQENCLRGFSLPSMNAKKTHCLRGHEFTPTNTRKMTSKGNGRVCIECARLSKREEHAKKKAAKQALIRTN